MLSTPLQDGSISLSRPRSFNAPLLILVVAALAFIADQWSKHVVTTRLFFDAHCSPWCGHKILIPGWLEIAPIPNIHGAFGMFGSSKPLLVVLALIVLVIFWWSFREAASRSRLVCIAFGMIAGGAVGNIVDRVHYGYVIDFIDFFRFPQIWRFTFNVGDSCITVGVVLLLLASLVRSRRHA
jgi:signal peptidase II